MSWFLLSVFLSFASAYPKFNSEWKPSSEEQIILLTRNTRKNMIPSQFFKNNAGLQRENVKIIGPSPMEYFSKAIDGTKIEKNLAASDNDLRNIGTSYNWPKNSDDNSLNDTQDITDNNVNETNIRKQRKLKPNETNNDDVNLRKNYEVTEADNSESSNNGYIYKEQEPNFFQGQNILLETLAKYNIHDIKEQRNYVNSRRKNINRSKFIIIPLPVKVPEGYNDGNHLPVNELLKVILSNYGVYLPGAHNEPFRNSYGYLASNNLHNNKPFGSYKLVADHGVGHK